MNLRTGARPAHGRYATGFQVTTGAEAVVGGATVSLVICDIDLRELEAAGADNLTGMRGRYWRTSHWLRVRPIWKQGIGCAIAVSRLRAAVVSCCPFLVCFAHGTL